MQLYSLHSNSILLPKKQSFPFLHLPAIGVDPMVSVGVAAGTIDGGGIGGQPGGSQEGHICYTGLLCSTRCKQLKFPDKRRNHGAW